MSQTVMPLHQPAGEPGNLNDVAELRQMLANQTAIENAARNHIAALEACREADLKKIAEHDETVASLKRRVRQLEIAVEDAKTCASYFDGEDAARNLAGVRRMMVNGDAKALNELTRILDRSFETWKHYA